MGDKKKSVKESLARLQEDLNDAKAAGDKLLQIRLKACIKAIENSETKKLKKG